MPILPSKSVRIGRVAWSALALALLLSAGCRNGSESAGAGRPLDNPPAAPAPPARQSAAASSLADRVWVRSDSTGMPGVMLIFLSDSTLVGDSCWETYRLARWQMESDSTLRWQEDASDIRATIRSLNDTELVLLMHLRNGSEEQHYTAAAVPYVLSGHEALESRPRLVLSVRWEIRVLRRSIVATLSLAVFVACQVRDSSRRTDSAAAADTPEMASTVALRATGTEPFWGLSIDTTGLRFTTPDDTMGIRWPPLSPMATGDTLRWVGETERAAIDARIWPAQCSDGMSDRVWTYTAVVRIDTTIYRGCAESLARPQVANALEGNWHIVAHHAPGIAAISGREADTWVGKKAQYSSSLAQFGTEQCSAPSYEAKNLTPRAFAEEFRVLSTDLGLRAPIQIVEVRCAGPWDGPGNRFFVKGPNELHTVWDGVFF